MTAAEHAEQAPAGTADAAGGAAGRWAERLSALSDRCNPILVREVQQALRGKAFVVTLSIALASIVVTALVCAVPAVGYWLTRKAWMPELTRFAWLAWIVVGFAFTYGNYLNVLARA